MPRMWIWISGWAICPDRFSSEVQSVLPNDLHQVLAPTQEALEKVLASDADCIGGYSLGSLILLSALGQFKEVTNITCLAPFIAFCKEAQLGGTTPRKVLRGLQQRLVKQPEKTIKLFYRLAGLNDEPTGRLPYPIEHLEWGLKQLATLEAEMILPNRVQAIAGSMDPLMDKREMSSKWPACHFIDDCDHNYRKLLSVLSILGPIKNPLSPQ